MMAQPVPNKIKGMRFPMRVFVRSEMEPNSGSRNSARMLSAAMIAPENVSFKWNVLVRIRGMMLSYICQKAEMDKNASPTRMVRLLFSFMLHLRILVCSADDATVGFTRVLPVNWRDDCPGRIVNTILQYFYILNKRRN